MSATSRHTGLPAALAHRSHTALTTAPVARWIAPLSGPIQRSWLSEVTWRQKRPMSSRDPVEFQPDQQMTHRADGSAADLVAAADGEGESVTFEASLVRLQNNVGGGIVGIRIHRVRAVEMLRRRKANVLDADIDDLDRHA